jgi:hypothetical protein
VVDGSERIEGRRALVGSRMRCGMGAAMLGLSFGPVLEGGLPTWGISLRLICRAFLRAKLRAGI